MDQNERQPVPYQVSLRQVWEAKIQSPFSDTVHIAYGETWKLAQAKAEVLLWVEATELGLEFSRPTQEELDAFFGDGSQMHWTT